MSRTAASSHEALPKTFADKPAALRAIKGWSEATTGRRLVQSCRSTKNFTLRCKGFRTNGCAFKVSVFKPTVQGVTQANWVLVHGKQTWRHT
jgi:hypothetical protein